MEINAASRASVQFKPEEKPEKKVAKEREELPEVKEAVQVEQKSSNKIDLTA